MFCDLKGATENPLFEKILHNAVTKVDFPAPDEVP
jgi:hypothetical protein